MSRNATSCEIGTTAFKCGKKFIQQAGTQHAKHMAPLQRVGGVEMETKPKILCVDDRPENLRVRALLLEQFGCEAITASDGSTAFQVLLAQSIDLMVIDYHLANGETGEEIAREVKRRWPGIPMIMLTGDSRLPASAVESVDEVFIKGAGSPAMLLDLIEKLLPQAKLKPRRPMLIPDPRSH